MTFSIEQFSLNQKVAVVTGAGERPNSIGRAYAAGLVAAGAAVVVADRNGPGAERVAAEIAAGGGRAIGVQVDITDPSSVARVARRAHEAFGGVDILVNNAALMVEVSQKPIIDTPLEEWRQVMDVNLTGALICSQAFVPLMKQRGGGKIVNTISGGAYPPMGLYGISKLGLAGLTVALARELGRDKINVNGIAPGNTMSAAGASLTPPGSPFKTMLEMMVAMRAEGQPDELVGALLLLCSGAGDWITGQVLHVDGGWIIRP